MADARAEPLRDPEAERYLMGIINNEIPYVPGSEYEQEEDVVSSFLNLEGEQRLSMIKKVKERTLSTEVNRQQTTISNCK